MMQLKYDPEADAIYIRFSDQKSAKMRTVRGNLGNAAVDYAADGSVVGVELLGVSAGIDLRGLPESEQIGALLQDHGFLVFPDRRAASVLKERRPYSERAAARKQLLENLLRQSGLSLDDLSESGQKSLHEYARQVSIVSTAPSASWNGALVELCNAVESELMVILTGPGGLEDVAQANGLGGKAHSLKALAGDQKIKQRLRVAGLPPGYILGTLPPQLESLVKLRSTSGAAHGSVEPQNATREDVEAALKLAVTGADAMIPHLVKLRKNMKAIK
ncbi:MAG: DUF2283 domain-containing protein [Chloroflexi bacterium]|nr:DUF2283 domain-containing protein [Chloroflexota bacterium]